ncbi:recombinase family protein [Candidatus Saccharibacteria bacterium]|nr:recombinase family protein [Candidatus Saccharibacteria bacterium]
MARKGLETIDPTKLRYILYARKSTEDKGSQERSIEDQIKDCEALIEREHLHILKPIFKEEKSAKIENNRPKFTEMIELIKTGKADGIIAWHPDRLSRNPIESAIIIDLLDKGIIKDLKFPTCQFSNDSSGKMLLNILFAISKQYSEHISEGVIRANESALEEGKSNGVPKWGYDRNKDGYYEPDNNYPFIRTAWEMKLSGIGHQEILDFLLDNDVHRMTKITRKNKISRRIEPSLTGLSTMFRDPFYYGLLIQAGQEVDLVEMTDGKFQPMITYDEYSAVQALGGGRNSKAKKRMVYYPLRGMVFCGVCGHKMVPGASSGSGGRYLYYRCDNKECARSQKSIRAINVLGPLFGAIRALRFSEKDYELYDKTMATFTDEKIIELRTERKSLEARKSRLETEARSLLDRYSVARNRNITAITRKLDNEIAENNNTLMGIDSRIQVLDDKINGAKQIALSKDEFLNLLKTLPDKIENGSIAEKDAIARIMLLNLKIDDQKRPIFLWKEPFATLLNEAKLDSGARYLNLYEPLCGVVEYVIVNPTWRPDFDLVESKLNPELQDFIY